MAVTLTLRGQDATTQDVIATLPPKIFDSDIADHGGLSITLVPTTESSILDGGLEDGEER